MKIQRYQYIAIEITNKLISQQVTWRKSRSALKLKVKVNVKFIFYPQAKHQKDKYINTDRDFCLAFFMVLKKKLRNHLVLKLKTPVLLYSEIIMTLCFSTL